MENQYAGTPFDEQGLQYAFDNTSISWFITCPRMYQYKMLERWRPKKTSVHLWFGGEFASALEHFYKYLADDVPYDEAIEKVVLETLISTWEYKRDEAGAIVEPRIGAPMVSFDNAKNRDTLVRSIIWYFDEHKDSYFKTVHLENGKPAAELSFKLAIDNGYYYCGHIDRVVEAEGQIYLMDQKTTGHTITDQFFRQFDLNFQMSGYTFAGKALYNIPIKGVIIDGAQIAVGFTRFQRNFTFRTDEQLDEWYEGLLWWIEACRLATEEYRVQQINLPQNLSSCDKYGGCEFRHVCARSPQVRSAFLKSDFDQQTQWNPLVPR